jgi:hypothetical protein
MKSKGYVMDSLTVMLNIENYSIEEVASSYKNISQ